MVTCGKHSPTEPFPAPSFILILKRLKNIQRRLGEEEATKGDEREQDNRGGAASSLRPGLAGQSLRSRDLKAPENCLGRVGSQVARESQLARRAEAAGHPFPPGSLTGRQAACKTEP